MHKSESAALDDILLDAKAIGEFLQVKTSRAYELMSNGTLPVIRIGRSVRVSKRSLERWVLEQEEKARQDVA